MKETSTGYVVQRKVHVVAIASHWQHDKSDLADTDSQVLCNMRHTFCALYIVYCKTCPQGCKQGCEEFLSLYILRCIWIMFT